MTTRVAVLVGSLRSASTNRRLAEQFVAHAGDDVEVQIIDGLDQLPFYNEEIDGDSAPAPAVALREAVAAADRVLVVTPEYNGTMPAVLKNAIDWLSRPYGAGAMVGKPFAAVGTAASQFGGKWAHEEARRAAKIAGAHVEEGLVLSAPGAELAELSDADLAERVGALLGELVSIQPVAA